MKSKILMIAITSLSLTANTPIAQSTTGRKIERVGKDVEKTGESVEKGAELFKKIFQKKDKDKTENQGGNTQGNSEDSNSEKTETAKDTKNTGTDSVNKKTSNLALSNPNSLKPGDVHPDAVVLDVDELFPFYDGAAIVRKGTSTALINSKGEFIVPFNKFQFNYYQNKSMNGFFLLNKAFSSKEGTGFVNSKGKYIDLQEFYGVTDGGRVIGDYLRLKTIKSNSYTYVFVDKEGNKYTLTELGPISSSEDAILYNGRVLFANNYKYGYKNIENKIVVNAIFDFAMPFSEGIAVVGAKNEFGEMKYGYIDTNGKPLTPLQFSRRPERFSNGLAKVYYHDVLHKYSFIDKKGEIVFTETNSSYYGPYYNGYTIAITGRQNEKIRDKEGKTYSKEEFLKLFGITDVRQGSVDVELPTTLISVYLSSGSPNKIKFYFDSIHDVRNYGFIDVDNGRAIYGKFSPGNHFNFDPVSKLAFAIFDKSKNSSDKTQGYINEEGIFMIVKGEVSKW
ncbi:WG repeat-containing protein [Arenibacter sp. F26102]|uniref:WG repeat-containing protein n=1 Tax=Arenibacter sp. F26102 TaxID=2926416 RepID=UPI001FF3F90C|nr:WG repeat-containing protein [Arenibacter sp. F26102]MCK0147637.1 WG repeat-containing protein [Arenibacter sp. F26102]